MPPLMKKVAHVLAVDGGGTKTAATLLNVAGQELATVPRRPGQSYRDPVAGLAEIAAPGSSLRPRPACRRRRRRR